EDIRAQVNQGHPVITLVHYRALPGNAWSNSLSDHWIVITGLFGTNFVYNDPAYMGTLGYARLMSEKTLLSVWAQSSIPRHAVAFAPGADGSNPETVDINFSQAARNALLSAATARGDFLELPGDESAPSVDGPYPNGSPAAASAGDAAPMAA